MAYGIVDHLKYNVWANEYMAKFIEPLDENLLVKTVQSSFDSLNKTLLHIWDAEVVWYKRIQGERVKEVPSTFFNGDKTDLISGLLKSSRGLVSFIEEKDSPFIHQKIDYSNLKGDAFGNTVEEILFHVVNHSTYHRGQVVTILRHLGIDKLPATDLIRYARTN
ncbi:MAG: hypothetical protein HC811_04955 [Flammeovirgaceae bacterium]|nr:hypothetical protein [Flammeovirgaceae bacterium]